MATLSDLTTRVKQNLYGAMPKESSFVTGLGASHDASTTAITVLDEDQWEVNDVGENLETGEQWLVLAKPGADVLTVSRAWNGTTAAASAGSGDLILQNPRFDTAFIEQAIQDTLDSFSGWGVHTFGQTSITRAAPTVFYELSVTDIDPVYNVLRVYEVDDNDNRPRTLPFRYYQNLGTGDDDLSEGQGLMVLDWGNTSLGDSIQVIYAQTIDAVADLLPRQEALVVVGATAQLLGGTIVPATHDPGARTDRTVAPGQTSRDVRHFQGRFLMDVRREAALLAVERTNLLAEPQRHTRARRWRA